MTDNPTNIRASRLDTVDAIRGFAVAGIMFVHLQQSYDCNSYDVDAISLVSTATFILLTGKVFAILAVCFGFSCRSITRGAPMPVSRIIFYVVRLAVLAAIGWLHGLLYRDDVLTLLALVGVLLLPIHSIKSNRVLLAIAAICFAQPLLLIHILEPETAHHVARTLKGDADLPALIYATGSFSEVIQINAWVAQAGKWSFLFASGRAFQTMGYAILGVIFGRTSFFDPDTSSPRPFNRPLTMMAVALVVVIAAKAYLHSNWFALTPTAALQKQFIVGWTDLLMTLGYLTAFMMLWKTNVRNALQAFCDMGRMSLSFYIGQSLIFVPLFYHFGGGICGTLGPNSVAVIGVAACIVQLRLAALCSRHFTYGPMEWLWRTCTSASMDVILRRKRSAT